MRRRHLLGALPAGMTITEAQGLNALARIKDPALKFHPMKI